MLKKIGLVLWSVCLMMSTSAQAVVILQYHHVSEKTPKSTSVTVAQFKEQMAYLANNGYQVIPLTDAVADIKNKRPSKPKTIALTFDDGYDSIYNNVAPVLEHYQFPYTVFVPVKPVNDGYHGVMTWAQIKALSQRGATIANHSWAHEHMIRLQDNETQAQWLQREEKNLLAAEADIKRHTGQSVKMLAYPYGEYNTQIEALLTKHGFVGFGQQSGAAGPHSILTALPRFPIAAGYADLNELKVKFASLNMPVLAQTPTNPQLDQGQWRPTLTVTIDTKDIYPNQLMCYVQGQGANKPKWISDNQFSVQAVVDLPAGRSRYNCTAPSKTRAGYYWFSQAWVRPKNDGSWIKE
ncbi:polysaccharide deacetylase family protein [Shewanella intestini]|uniref:Polysaccharide deacetylase family protein n=1 Tax=Shewanella intestini TaxID=2017544 RepID=A0ABS5I3W6_9GAMM|nr:MULTISPECIES: polysaccharide deacetylase family protein [Shewanella]MBR9728065.1 polysaccharide deacetylase family protein [Shewanella intestini]MRG36537.1 polysaccharide deacetylase family protein [Shewanella sp. XMDDZSB0408]